MHALRRDVVSTVTRDESRGVVLRLIAAGLLLWLGGVLALRALYFGAVPLLDDILMRSRASEPLATYLQSTRELRLWPVFVVGVIAAYRGIEIRRADLLSVLRRSPAAQLAVVLGTYVAAWGLLLLSTEAIWWDDWPVLFLNDPQALPAVYLEVGLPALGYFHWLMSFGGPVGYSLVMFAAWSASAVALLFVARRIPTVTPTEAVFAAAIFSAVPLFAARNAAILGPYVVALGALLLVWSIMSRPERPRTRDVMVIGIAAFVASMIHSTAFFLVVPFFHFAWVHRNRLTDARVASTLALVAAAPTLSYLSFLTIFAPFGAYANYNSIKWGMAFAALVATAAVSLAWFVLARDHVGMRVGTVRWALHPLLLGVLLTSLASLPYIATGRVPLHSEWSTRHELIMPVGIAVIAIGALRVLRLIFSRRTAEIVAVGFLAFSVVSSSTISWSYFRDTQKQSEVVALLEASEVVRDSDVVLFLDETRGRNVHNRWIRYHEWEGMMSLAFGSHSRIAVVDEEQLAWILTSELGFGPASGRYLYDGSLRRSAAELRFARVAILPAGNSQGPLELVVLEQSTLLRDERDDGRG